MKDAVSILRFLQDAAARGERSALVTITDIVGSSSRAPGTHMAVAESGRFVGSFSGGCVEAAVVGEAQRVIAGGVAEQMRLGAGSPLIDIRLPCGGGLDFLIVPEPDQSVVREALERLCKRHSVALRMTPGGALSLTDASDAASSGWDDGAFIARHAPDPRLVILGHGAEVVALAALGIAYGMSAMVLSPDERIVSQITQGGGFAHHLKTPAPSSLFEADADTAVVFLFHDHDWETALLLQALKTDAFYIGAMGSRRTHAQRVSELVEHGVSPETAARVTGPIGLIPASRDPETLALSVLAQIVAERTGPRLVRSEKFDPRYTERAMSHG